jgi:hypothetical protein
MLETQLAELTAQIAALVEVLKANAQPHVIREPRQAEAPIPAAPEPELEVELEPEVEPEPEPEPERSIPAKPKPDDEVSIAMLQDVCMTITRPDPNRKPEVVAIISSFGGALKVQDVPVADRKALLERLKLL